MTDAGPKEHPQAIASAERWRALRGRLSAYFTPRVADESNAEDLVQEVLARVHKHRDKLGEIENVGGWVQRVATNVLTDHYRRTASARSAVERFSAEPTLRVTGEEAKEPSEPGGLSRCLSPLVAGLPPAYAEALQLVELDGLTQRAAADRVGLSLSGMKSRVQRARAALKRSLLDCCDVELDARAAVVDYTPRSASSCAGCGDCG